MSFYKLKSEAITVGTSAVQLRSVSKPLLSCSIQATSTNTVPIYIGGSDVSTTNGYAIAPGNSVDLADIFSGRGVHEWDVTKVYLISGSAAQNARILVSDESKA